ncbi:MAG: hypothetical protein QOJ03_2686 [Frankiaceae bacterium]|nr:hypothetical protein [Frankiaceae bacterium]
MTVQVPEGLGALQALADDHPELADRVATLQAALARIEPFGEDPAWDRVEGIVVHGLRPMGVVDDEETGGVADGAAVSGLIHRALERALANDQDPAGLDFVHNNYLLAVGNRVADLANALGREFRPDVMRLLDIVKQSPEFDRDFRHQVAWLSARRGADALIAGLGAMLFADPERALDFLQTVVDAEAEGPWRGAEAPMPAPPPAADMPMPAPPPAPMPAPPPAGAPTPWHRLPTSRFVRDLMERLRGGRLFRSDVPLPAVVSTGFAPERGAEGLPAERTLGQGRRYQFFVEIGRTRAADAINTDDTPLPDLPAGTVLQVALFGFDGELQPEAGFDVGELRLVGDGTAVVESQPGGAVAGQQRLYLAVSTPEHPGIFRMRCNIYCRQVLLQSRLLAVQVTDEERTVGGPALESTLDFAVVSRLRPEQVEGLEPRTLSLLVNDNGDGTHGFRFFAGTEFKHDATLGGELLTATLEKARAGLRRASWAKTTEPTREEFAKLAYRYADPTDAKLAEDLKSLARSGFTVWDVLIDRLAGGAADRLRALMRTPGVIELANKESLDLVVPAACIYDHPLNAEQADLTICKDFLAARGVTSLAATPCFQGHCPSYDDPTVVCPSGFWGFRHQIGYSASLTGGESGDAHDQELRIAASPQVFTVGASSDKGLKERDGHLDRLHGLVGEQWNEARTRTALFELFKTVAPSVVYLYGHGGSSAGSAFFEVGSGDDGPIIRASLRGRADWRATRPLVFLNGCHSAALAPDAAFTYATGFLQTAHASAVVGTEIAVFEKLAVAFAEDCLHRFVVKRKKLGEAVLGARLSLLEQGIPLGLVYVAFGPSELHLAA